MRWVHRYAVGGAAFAALPLPISTTAGLSALEVHMLGFIGRIYGEESKGLSAIAAMGGFEMMGGGLKFIATRAVSFLPILLGPAIRAGIAAVVIESIGRGVVGHFERKYPGRVFSPAG